MLRFSPMNKVLAISLLCLATSCGSGEASFLILEAPCTTDGRRVQVDYSVDGFDMAIAKVGALTDWNDSWVTLKINKDEVAYIPTAKVQAVKELAGIYK